MGIRLIVNLEVFRYQPRGLPIVNWLLYTYGVPRCAASSAPGGSGGTSRRGAGPEHDWMPGDRSLSPRFSVLGLVLVFWLINVEIVDYFSPGTYWEYAIERPLARDLAMSVAWGLYAIVPAFARHLEAVEGAALPGARLHLPDVRQGPFLRRRLGRLEGLYRVLSLVSLATSMFVVALLFQRFVSGRERTE